MSYEYDLGRVVIDLLPPEVVITLSSEVVLVAKLLVGAVIVWAVSHIIGKYLDYKKAKLLYYKD